MVLFDWYYLLSRDGLKIKNSKTDDQINIIPVFFFFLHLISSCTFAIINSSLGLRFILAREIKRKRNQTTDRWSERIGYRHRGMLVNLYTSADPLTSSQSLLSSCTLNTASTTVFCESSTVVCLNLGKSSLPTQLLSSPLPLFFPWHVERLQLRPANPLQLTSILI